MKNLTVVLLLCLATLSASAQDLKVNQVTSSLNFNQYNPISFSILMENTGAVDINKLTTTRGYLSADNILDPNDQVIGNAGLLSIAGNSTKSLNFIAYTDMVFTPGNYFLILSADANNQVAETNEANNIFIAPDFIINPANLDLQFSVLSVPTSVPVYDVITPTYSVKNSERQHCMGYAIPVFISVLTTCWMPRTKSSRLIP